MWSFVLILVGAQLCVGLTRQQQQEVEVLESTRVNCKVSAIVTYPEIAEENAMPTVDCTTKCAFKTNEKDQSYFIGYVYRHFERLEMEYGLMLKIRYSKGGDKSCVLVPAADNEEVLSTHLEGNTPCAPTTVPSTTGHVTHDPIPTTVLTTVPPTTISTTDPTTHAPMPTTVPTTVTPTTTTTTIHTTHYRTPTTMSTTVPPTTIPITTSWVCGSDWALIGTACFHISEVHGDWHKGQDYCMGLGATLASVRSQEEQDGLADLVDDNAWIGLHDMNSEGEHLWEDQTTLSYSNWEPGQPDNNGQFLWWGGEDCVEMKMTYNFRWNDQDCSTENKYICRKDAELQG